MNNQAKYQELSQRLQSSEEFKNRFLDQPKSVLKEIGIQVPNSIAIKVHEDTATVRNFVLPASVSEDDETTASNPLFRKAIAKAHSDANFKARLRQNPKSAIAELTVENLPEDLDICVHENTSNLKHLVIFVDSASEELSERELEAVAGGVSVIKLPFPTVGLVEPPKF